MNERAQRIVWTVLVLVAVGLSAATVCLYLQTKPAASAAKGTYRIAYVAEREGSFRIFITSADGADSVRLSEGQEAELFPVCEPILDDSNREPGKGEWISIEKFIHENADLDITSGYCPECTQKTLNEFGSRGRQ